MKMNISWQESFSIGIGEIDVQHRKIISIINSALAENKEALADGHSSEKYIRLLDEGHDSHFACEEAYMLGFGYHKYKQHKAQHDMFREKIKMGKELTGEQAREFLRTISEELALHIMEADREMAEFFQSKKR
jgi:hemerythrin-like metal-binding protein